MSKKADLPCFKIKLIKSFYNTNWEETEFHLSKNNIDNIDNIKCFIRSLKLEEIDFTNSIMEEDEYLPDWLELVQDIAICDIIDKGDYYKIYLHSC